MSKPRRISLKLGYDAAGCANASLGPACDRRQSKELRTCADSKYDGFAIPDRRAKQPLVEGRGPFQVRNGDHYVVQAPGPDQLPSWLSHRALRRRWLSSEMLRRTCRLRLCHPHWRHPGRDCRCFEHAITHAHATRRLPPSCPVARTIGRAIVAPSRARQRGQHRPIFRPICAACRR